MADLTEKIKKVINKTLKDDNRWHGIIKAYTIDNIKYLVNCTYQWDSKKSEMELRGIYFVPQVKSGSLYQSLLSEYSVDLTELLQEKAEDEGGVDKYLRKLKARSTRKKSEGELRTPDTVRGFIIDDLCKDKFLGMGWEELSKCINTMKI